MLNQGPTSSVTSLSLLERARQHDPAAWRQLCDLYAPLIYGWARKAGVHSDDAADVVQEVFRVATTHLVRFRHDRQGDTFRGWLITVTRTEIRAFFRKRGRQSSVGEWGSTANVRMQQVPDLQETDPLSDSFVQPSSERSRLVRRSAEIVRGDFAPRTWEAFWRSVVEGHDVADIARDLNMTANSIRQARFRVLNRLREFMQEWA